MDLDSEVTAILTTIGLSLIIVISILLYVHFKAKKEAGDTNDHPNKK
jgi:hypothetical protein